MLREYIGPVIRAAGGGPFGRSRGRGVQRQEGRIGSLFFGVLFQKAAVERAIEDLIRQCERKLLKVHQIEGMRQDIARMAAPEELPGGAVTLLQKSLQHAGGQWELALRAKVLELSLIHISPKKFDNTEVLYDGGPNQNIVREISLGGTKTRLVFN